MYLARSSRLTLQIQISPTYARLRTAQIYWDIALNMKFYDFTDHLNRFVISIKLFQEYGIKIRGWK
jgi:hypothetical protein